MSRSGQVLDGQQAMIQKLLLYGMPISLFVSGFLFPLGVLLYWFTNNLWTMGQQFYILHRMPPPGAKRIPASQWWWPAAWSEAGEPAGPAAGRSRRSDDSDDDSDDDSGRRRRCRGTPRARPSRRPGVAVPPAGGRSGASGAGGRYGRRHSGIARRAAGTGEAQPIGHAGEAGRCGRHPGRVSAGQNPGGLRVGVTPPQRSPTARTARRTELRMGRSVHGTAPPNGSSGGSALPAPHLRPPPAGAHRPGGRHHDPTEEEAR